MILAQAGLFSAILSAFLIEVRRGLQEDLQAITNALLQVVIQNQHNSTGPPAPFVPPRFEPSPSVLWINGLWFSSLIFSLISALGASLAKGWVMQYATTASGVNSRDACVRHHRFIGITRWHLQVIVQSLPILIHIAFFLFSAGLVILLREDNLGISNIVLALVVVVAFLYVGSTLLPLFSLDCPFRTPVSSFISRFVAKLIALSQDIPSSDFLKSQALAWLLVNSADGKVIQESAQAIAGLPANVQVQDALYQSSVADVLVRGLSECNKVLRDGRNSPLLSTYLYAILHLVQTGPLNHDAATINALVSLVKPGSPLDLSNNLERGIYEIALCIKARILLLLCDRHDEIELFNMDIPILLKSSSQPHIRRLLLEVHLLDNNSTRTVPDSICDPRRINQAWPLLDMLKSENTEMRTGGHERLLHAANTGMYVPN